MSAGLCQYSVPSRHLWLHSSKEVKEMERPMQGLWTNALHLCGFKGISKLWRRFDEGHGLRRKRRRRLGDWANDYVWRSFNPPFKAAVAEYPWWQSYSNDSLLEIQYSGLFSATNSTNLACFRSLPEDTLDTASQTIYTKVYVDDLYKYGSFYYGPSIHSDNNARPSFQRI